MITRLELENYRRFERYRLSGLARVNLLVGRNNSGKTSILEAVHLLDTPRDPEILPEIAETRGEVIKASKEYGERGLLPDASHFFHGHQTETDAIFSIHSDLVSTNFQITLNQDDSKNYITHVLQTDKMYIDRATYLLTFANDGVSPKLPMQSSYYLTGDGGIFRTPISDPRSALAGRSGRGPTQFLGIDPPNVLAMNRLWDRINMERREGEVIEAMRILEPSLDRLYLPTSVGLTSGEPRTRMTAALKDRSNLLPLGSFGEGMSRMLAISLALVSSQGGTLAIDEIDTGLHYSVMGDLWLMVVEAARRNDVQVFATTHSLDCIRGLAWLCEHHPGLGGEVSLQKIEPTLEEAVAFDARSIRIADEQDIEVR